MSKKTKKRLIISAIPVVLIIYILYIGLNYIYYTGYKSDLKTYQSEEGKEYKAIKESTSEVKDMDLVAENDYLKLYTNTKTTEIAIYDKRDKKITYSNPIDRSEDLIATGRNKTALNSQFMVTYYDSSMTETTMYNYDYSVERGQFDIESIDDGIRYTYLLGNLDNPTGLVPPLISKERLEELVLSKITEKEARTIKNSYFDSKEMEDFFELTNGARNNKVGMNKLNKIFEAAGYTLEDYDVDAELASGGSGVEKTTFTIVIEYKIIDDKLEVTLPTDKIVEQGKGRIGSIDLLPFFAASGINEEGYMLVPNGTGSLINFNNGKKVERYNQYIYGIDETQQSYTVVERTTKAKMPVFGIKKSENAIFAEITEGDSLTNLISNVSGGANSYNFIYPVFVLRGTEKVSMFGSSGSSADLPTVEKNIYNLNIKVEYGFLNKEDASYAGMANYYRNSLIQRGKLKLKEDADSIPFYLDIVGGVKKQTSFMGIPYFTVYPMTTFDEAGIIIDDFVSKDVKNLRVNYLGWFNGGYYHDTAKKIKVDKKLGGKKDLAALNNKLEEMDSKLFGDVALQKVSFAAKNYNYKMENSQYYSGYVVALGRVNPATLRQTGGMGYIETNYNILSPKFLSRYVDKMLKKLDNVDLSGISLRDLGNTLTADKRRSNVINREEAKHIAIANFDKISEQKDSILVNGANSYAFEYATDIIEAPISHNNFHIVDKEVPFYQMVIHGSIDYSANAINLNGGYDKQDIILKMIEFGMSPRFTLSYEESNEIKYTGLNSFYSTQYKLWIEEAAIIYKEVNEVLKHVTNSIIINHEDSNGIKKVTYDNGFVIYVNTTKEDINMDGHLIKAKDYKMVEVME